MDKISNTNITLRIDSREEKLIEYFKKYEWCKIETLDLGDLIFFKNNEPLLIIERKTINDLNASIIDGRYREQKARLIKSNCNITYLIEGNIMYHKSKSTLIGGICNLIYRDNIKIIKTISITETIEYIEKIFKKYCNNDFEKKINNNIKNYRIKKGDCYNVVDCFKLQLNLIPRVSINMAKMLSDKYKNMSNLITYLKTSGKDGLKDLEYNTGKKEKKIGVKMSEKIYKSLI